MFTLKDMMTGFDKVIKKDDGGRVHIVEEPNTVEYNPNTGAIKPISKNEGNNDE